MKIKKWYTLRLGFYKTQVCLLWNAGARVNNSCDLHIHIDAANHNRQSLKNLMILTVYGRFFRIFMATAIAPIPLASFAGEPTANIGKSFIKTYAALCLQGCVIVLACVIFSVVASEEPTLGNVTGMSAVTITWQYIGELLFNIVNL